MTDLQLHVTAWLNTEGSGIAPELSGRVVVLHAFQMLCPGCVIHGLPQAQRIADTFPPDRVAVIGLHTVFEHHEVMTRQALDAFVHEYRWTFPIGIDDPSPSDHRPRTMVTYGMQGTPSLLLFDASGKLRVHEFGRPSDMAVGAQIAALQHSSDDALTADNVTADDAVCTLDGACGPADGATQ